MRNSIKFGIFGLILSMNYATACSPSGQIPTTEQLAAKATSIFIGRIVRQELVTNPEAVKTPKEIGSFTTFGQPSIVMATLEVSETIKGKEEKIKTIRSLSAGIGNCFVPLLTGVQYIVMLENDDLVLDFHNFAKSFLNLNAPTTKKELDIIRESAKSTK